MGVENMGVENMGVENMVWMTLAGFPLESHVKGVDRGRTLE